MMWVGFSFQALGLFVFLRNLLTGFQLAQDSTASPEPHLSSALIAAGLSVMGAAILVKTSAARLLSAAQSDKVSEIYENRQKAVVASIIMVLCILLVTITGSFSQGGTWPVLHLLVALSLYGSSFTSLVFWIQCLRRL